MRIDFIPKKGQGLSEKNDTQAFLPPRYGIPGKLNYHYRPTQLRTGLPGKHLALFPWSE